MNVGSAALPARGAERRDQVLRSETRAMVLRARGVVRLLCAAAEPSAVLLDEKHVGQSIGGGVAAAALAAYE